MTDPTLADDTHPLLTEVLAFAGRVDESARRLFGGSELHGRLYQITRQLQADCRRLIARGATATPTLVLMGSVGEGKSWLARCFLATYPDNEAVRAELRSGQNHEDRTERLTWFGPAPPASLEEPGERFLLVPENQLLDLGRPYVVGDTPGYSDIDQFRRMLSGLASTSASIKVLVCSFSQVRDGGLAEYVAQLDGALILPVIRFRPAESRQSLPSEKTRTDVDQEIATWRRLAPTAVILPPCFMPDKDLFGELEAEAVVRERLKLALAPQLAHVEQLQLAIDRQIEQRLLQARREMAVALLPFRQRVGPAVSHLEQLTHRLPEQLISQLVGEDLNVQAVLRPRFRADWIARTPAIFFPYRSLLGLLALTAGAWDRLVFSLAGSAPSLVLTFLQSAKNVRDVAETSRQILDGLNHRTERLLQDEFRPAIRQFRAAVAASVPAGDTEPGEATGELDMVHLAGLDALQVESRRIFLSAIQSRRSSLGAVLFPGLLATGAFGYLIAGPLVSLYRAYITAHEGAFRTIASRWTDFPTPSFPMLVSSFLLSVVPVFVVALCAMAWSCRGGRVRRAIHDVRRQHQEAITHRLAHGALRIELTDPQLDAVRTLLNLAADAGPAPPGQVSP